MSLFNDIINSLDVDLGKLGKKDLGAILESAVTEAAHETVTDLINMVKPKNGGDKDKEKKK